MSDKEKELQLEIDRLLKVNAQLVVKKQMADVELAWIAGLVEGWIHRIADGEEDFKPPLWKLVDRAYKALGWHPVP